MNFKRLAIALVAVSMSGCGDDGAEQLKALQADKQALTQQLSEQRAQFAQLLEQNKQLTEQLSAIQSQLAALPGSTQQTGAAQVSDAAQDADATQTGSNVDIEPGLSLPNSETEPAFLKPSGADETKKLEPGWIVEAFSMKVDGANSDRFLDPEPVSMGSFVSAPGEINMLDHRKFLPGKNHVMYRGEAYITVQNRGPHAFAMTLAQNTREFKNDSPDNTRIYCDLSLSIEGTPLIADRLGVGRSEVLTATGAVDLVEGLYKSVFEVTCNSMSRPYQDSSRGAEWRDNLLSTLNLEISARRPGQASLTPLGVQDAVYVAK